MKKFVEVFIQEATELINELEESLLILESAPDDGSSLDSVFRVMHTLKGNAKMFGFEEMGALTHQLENIYDTIRSKNIAAGPEILSITLKAVDHLRNMLSDHDLQQSENKAKQKEILTYIENVLLKSELANLKVGDENDGASVAESAKAIPEELCTYYIVFHPEENLMRDGTNPVFILDDLAALGKTMIHAHKKNIPSFDQLDPTKCYTFWEIYLVTDKTVEQIEDVFLFVQDSSVISIHKVADVDLLGNETFVEKIKESRKKEVLIDIDDLQEYVNRLLQIIREKTVEESRLSETVDYKISSIRVSSDKIDSMMNLVSELVTTQARLANISGNTNIQGLTEVSETIQKLSRQLRDNVFSISLVPIHQLFVRFQRLVRDLSRELGKEVDFTVEGGDTELDKKLIDALTDPVMHILRNCLDHGVEPPEMRLKRGKSKRGNLFMKAFYSGANVHIKISDDGRGLDYKKILEKAIEKGLAQKGDKLDDKQINNLLFLPGFSTASQVTDVSGRGVGMDIVRKKIEEIRGEVLVESVEGHGTSITIKLPLTLSIIDGLLVRVKETPFIIQTGIISKISVVPSEEVHKCFNDLLVIDNEQIQLVDLRKEFHYERNEKLMSHVVIVAYEGTKIGIVVDVIAGQIQAVVKPLGEMYRHQEFLSGATILGDGSVALILDTNKLIYQSVDLI